jgi:putative ABC transport system permease protein
VDPNFLETFGVKITKGRFFSTAYGSDDQVFVLNEAAVKAMGMKDPVGKWFDYYGKHGPIIGIVKDYHYASLRNEIEPQFMMILPEVYRYLCLKVTSQDLTGTLRSLEQEWKNHAPNFPFEFHFLDESLEVLYVSEQRAASLILTFSVLAIVISCLGLFGFVASVLETRTKEIGIRKVMGASGTGIILLFSKEFIKWVALANLFAWPAAYFVMRTWLNNYPYRTAISWWIFAAGAGIALGIALLTITGLVIRSATANPVDSLRYE